MFQILNVPNCGFGNLLQCFPGEEGLVGGDEDVVEREKAGEFIVLEDF